MSGDACWTVGPGDASALASFLRERLHGCSWARVKRLIETGKITVGAVTETSPGRRLVSGDVVRLDLSLRRAPGRGAVRIVHDDAHVVVIDKPAGIMSVPYERGDRGTAMDLLREAWRRRGQSVAPLLVVHRLDKDTSGLMLFAKTKRAESDLGRSFRRHDVDRAYLCVAHGEVPAGTIESRLVEDRGDGLRGSGPEGKRAVTHVRPLRRLAGATLCEVRLETGRTHQIRIHLAETGHPLVGERVYIRDFVRAGCEPLEAPRLLLHAAILGFVHPVSGLSLAFEAPAPNDFRDALHSLEH